ncbi:MAG: prepilin peptidase [Candidatus Margulisbacteria bacterium]|jgi:leader peptidase (prepilin peptidase)/N-methyltransferase|nr:prepilin peptidase [Candidatus Margulisiibacteriota bacterium]
MSSLTLLFAFGLGTVLGSFLNVCIYRLPRGESLIFPGSHCPHCGRQLSAFELFPLISFLLLRGRCRGCQVLINPRYPLVELLMGLLTALAFLLAAGNWLWLFFACFIVGCLLAIFFIDLELQVIPDALSYAGIGAGLLYNLIRGPGTYFVSALIGACLGYLILFAIAWAGRLIFRQEALGEGDLFLAALLGACFGWQGLLLALLLSYLGAAAVLLAFLAVGRIKMGQPVPFGPALATGGIVTLFWGEQIIRWYLFLPL